MKANDLLYAIGDVDEELVKRAHRRNRVKALLASAITLLLGICVTCFMMQPTRILTRIHPDFAVNIGYIDPAYLEADRWTSLEQTTFENGREIASTQFRQMLYGSKISVRHSAQEGELILAYISSGDSNWQDDYLLNGKEKIPYISGRYTEDLIGRIDSMIILSERGYAAEETVLNFVRIEYLKNGIGDDWVFRQTKQQEDGTVTAYRTYDYTNSRLSRTQDYTPDGVRTGYTEYTYEDYLCIGRSYLEDGTLTGIVHTKTDWLGRLRWREYYTPSGELLSQEIFHYRFWELYQGFEGYLTAFCLLSITLTMGIYINDDPITVKARKKSLAGDEKTEE